MIVLPDADLDMSADAAVSASFGAAGQRCMAVSVVVAVGDIADDLISKIQSRMPDLVMGVTDDDKTQLGPVISQANKDRIYSFIDTAESDGASLVVDGRHRSNSLKGCFVGPTLIDNVKPGMSVYENEIFGPVLCFVRAKTYDEAMQITHSHKLGNGAALFTRDGGVAKKWSEEIQAGSVGINVPIPLPTYAHSFGGWKDSGFSETKAFGPSSIDFYTKTKSLTTRWPDPAESKVDLGFLGMINSLLDRVLSILTHFVFIFVDVYMHLRILVRESIVSNPLINRIKFKEHFVMIDEMKHPALELGDANAPSNKTLVMIGGIPTDPMESMTWFADCLNQIDPSLRIIIFNMPYYDQHFSIEHSNQFAQSSGESLRTHKAINYSNRKIDPKFSHKNQSKTINSLMDQMNIDQAHIIGHDRGAVILENLCINNPEKVISYSRASQVWDYADPEWSKLAPEILVGPPHKLMSIYFQLRLLLFSVLIMNKPIQLLSENFIHKAKNAKKGTHLYDRYTHLKFKSQISYKNYYYKFQQSLMQGGMFDEVDNRKYLKHTNIPIMQFQGEDEFKLAPNGCRISDQPYFGKYNLFRNEIEDIFPDATHQSEVPIKSEFITEQGLYKEIKVKDGARFSKFYLIPDSAHFNVIENPESCAAAVYNFINLQNNNFKGSNNDS